MGNTNAVGSFLAPLVGIFRNVVPADSQKYFLLRFIILVDFVYSAHLYSISNTLTVVTDTDKNRYAPATALSTVSQPHTQHKSVCGW